MAGPFPELLLAGNRNALQGTIPLSAAPPPPRSPFPAPQTGSSSFLPHTMAQILFVLESDNLDLKQLCDIRSII